MGLYRTMIVVTKKNPGRIDFLMGLPDKLHNRESASYIRLRNRYQNPSDNLTAVAAHNQMHGHETEHSAIITISRA